MPFVINDKLTDKIYSDISDADVKVIGDRIIQVYNTNKDFSIGHTHINNFSTAKYIAYLALYKRLPKKNHLSIYLIDSVIRISDDLSYINKMSDFKMSQIKKDKDK